MLLLLLLLLLMLLLALDLLLVLYAPPLDGLCSLLLISLLVPMPVAEVIALLMLMRGCCHEKRGRRKRMRGRKLGRGFC